MFKIQYNDSIRHQYTLTCSIYRRRCRSRFSALASRDDDSGSAPLALALLASPVTAAAAGVDGGLSLLPFGFGSQFNCDTRFTDRHSTHYVPSTMNTICRDSNTGSSRRPLTRKTEIQERESHVAVSHRHIYLFMSVLSWRLAGK